MESQPQDPEFWNHTENFHPCNTKALLFFKDFGFVFRHLNKSV